MIVIYPGRKNCPQYMFRNQPEKPARPSQLTTHLLLINPAQITKPSLIAKKTNKGHVNKIDLPLDLLTAKLISHKVAILL